MPRESSRRIPSAASDDEAPELPPMQKIGMATRTWAVPRMEFLGPMRLSEVEEVQLRIVQQVRQLEEHGQVTIVRGESDDTFV